MSQPSNTVLNGPSQTQQNVPLNVAQPTQPMPKYQHPIGKPSAPGYITRPIAARSEGLGTFPPRPLNYLGAAPRPQAPLQPQQQQFRQPRPLGQFVQSPSNPRSADSIPIQVLRPVNPNFRHPGTFPKAPANESRPPGIYHQRSVPISGQQRPTFGGELIRSQTLDTPDNKSTENGRNAFINRDNPKSALMKNRNYSTDSSVLETHASDRGENIDERRISISSISDENKGNIPGSAEHLDKKNDDWDFSSSRPSSRMNKIIEGQAVSNKTPSPKKTVDLKPATNDKNEKIKSSAPEEKKEKIDQIESKRQNENLKQEVSNRVEEPKPIIKEETPIVNTKKVEENNEHLKENKLEAKIEADKVEENNKHPKENKLEAKIEVNKVKESNKQPIENILEATETENVDNKKEEKMEKALEENHEKNNKLKEKQKESPKKVSKKNSLDSHIEENGEVGKTLKKNDLVASKNETEKNKEKVKVKTEKNKPDVKNLELKNIPKMKSAKKPEGDNDSGVDESTQGNDQSSNGDHSSPRKSSAKPTSRSSTTTPTKNRPLSRGSKSPSLKSPDSTASTPGATEKKKLPMNKVQVGSAPSPNLKVVRSKIGSLENASYKPGGGKVKIESKKLDFKKAAPKIEAKNDKYVPKGGERKIQQQKLQWNAKSKIGSLENASHKPKGGDKKIETVKLDFKEKAKPKVGSKDNMKHVPGGGDIKFDEVQEDVKPDIENKKLDLKVQSKIGSFENVKHKPGGGDKKIFDDKEYLKQMSAISSEDPSLTGSQTSLPSQPEAGGPIADENLNQEH